jgi:hypothetical protein
VRERRAEVASEGRAAGCASPPEEAVALSQARALCVAVGLRRTDESGIGRRSEGDGRVGWRLDDGDVETCLPERSALGRSAAMPLARSRRRSCGPGRGGCATPAVPGPSESPRPTPPRAHARASVRVGQSGDLRGRRAKHTPSRRCRREITHRARHRP